MAPGTSVSADMMRRAELGKWLNPRPMFCHSSNLSIVLSSETDCNAVSLYVIIVHYLIIELSELLGTLSSCTLGKNVILKLNLCLDFCVWSFVCGFANEHCNREMIQYGFSSA